MAYEHEAPAPVGRRTRTRGSKRGVYKEDSSDEEEEKVLEEDISVPATPEPVIDRIMLHRVKSTVNVGFVQERRERLAMKSLDPFHKDKHLKEPIDIQDEEIPEEFDLRVLEREELVEFYVKWKGWSVRHSEWIPCELLKNNRAGQVRLQRYLKQRRDEAEMLLSATDEEREDFLIKWELSSEVIQQYQIVDNILDRREVLLDEGMDKNLYDVQVNPDTGVQYIYEYLVKWKEMDEEDCTWETLGQESKEIEGFTQHVQAYEEFLKKPLELRVPPKVQQRVMYQFRGYPAQPKWITDGELRDYQLVGLNFLLTSWTRGRNVILADEMGLGKTIQTAAFLGALRNDFKQGGPSLVVVPLSTIHAWLKELRQWAPNLHVVLYYGSAKSRAVIRGHCLLKPTPEDFLLTEAFSSNSVAINNPSFVTADYIKKCMVKGMTPKFHVVLTTYELLLKDADILKSFNFQMMVIDEAHRLKNDKSKLADALDSFQVAAKVLITGTPLQNSLRELWNLLNFLDPLKFGDWDAFHVNYGDLSGDDQVSKLHSELAPFILRRLKKDVEKGIPGKIERIIRVELSPIQKKFYKWILTRNFDQLKKVQISTICLISWLN
ncbi:hypothetical protein GEMRC1_005944 [Eukaryota sp. GEM-RC1]